MPRHYQRKTETKYKLVDLEKAVEAVKSKKLSLGKAAITFSVPKSTIHDYLSTKTIKTPRTGRKTIFSEEQEAELEKHILNCCKQFYGLTIEMVRKIAFTFAEVNKLKHNFDKKSRMAGKDWFYGFKKRHPNITLRRPESTSINRITAFNQIEVKMFFNNLEALQLKYQFDANRMYNVDESGISNVQRNSRILAPKGQKQVGMITSGERGTTTTVVCAFSASGNYIPPFFIFIKRKRMNPQLLRGGNSDMVAATSDKGWINENLFVDWLHHFISYAKPTTEKPILLILDNHESHVSLPPHTSHRLQPLDLTFFGPLKTAYNRQCDSYMASHVGQKITQYEVVELFTKAFNRISNIEKAANGFRAAGIWPLDATKFDEQFLEATPYEIQSISSNNQSTQLTHTSQASKEKGATMQTISDIQIVSSSNIQTPSAQEAHVPDQKGTITPEAQITNLESIPLKEIVNIPQIQQPKIKRTYRKRHSIIITSTPMKDALEEKEKKKNKNEKIKLKVNVNKNKKGVKNLKFAENKINKKKKNQEELYCLICEERYQEPIIEDWIMCYHCKLWAHEKCTSGESTSKGYLCDLYSV